jgi:hypothetical protein
MAQRKLRAMGNVFHETKGTAGVMAFAAECASLFASLRISL